jgi:hypothetical protein
VEKVNGREKWGGTSGIAEEGAAKPAFNFSQKARYLYINCKTCS